jgi:hypothetical protein
MVGVGMCVDLSPLVTTTLGPAPLFRHTRGNRSGRINLKGSRIDEAGKPVRDPRAGSAHTGAAMRSRTCRGGSVCAVEGEPALVGSGVAQSQRCGIATMKIASGHQTRRI